MMRAKALPLRIMTIVLLIVLAGTTFTSVLAENGYGQRVPIAEKCQSIPIPHDVSSGFVNGCAPGYVPIKSP